MSDNYIEFRKKRDLGAIISDSLGFLAKELQPLLSTVIKTSVIPMIITLFFAIYFTGSAAVAMDAYFEGALTRDMDMFFTVVTETSFLLSLFLFLVSITFTYASMSVATFAYIKSYANGRGTIDYNEIKSIFNQKLLSYFGLSLLTGFVLIIGYVLCFLPGIYFGIVFAMAGPLLIFEDRTVLSSFEESFNFIKGHWWNTFGVFLVLGIIIAVANWILNKPMDLYAEASSTPIIDLDTSSILSIFTDPIYVLLIIFSYILEFFFHLIRMIFSAFVFYDIEEQDNPSTPDIIDSIGAE